MARYFWDSAHNTLAVDDEDFEDGVLKPGHALRVRMTAMDSTQVAIAQSEYDETDETDDDTDDEFIDQQALYDIERAEISAIWRGGLQISDHVRIKNRDFVISGRNPENGKFQLTDAGELTGDEAKQAAYDSYEADIQTAYLRDKVLPSNTARVGGQCMLNGVRGTYRMKGGELVCVTGESKEPSDREWEMGGPLSDAQTVLSGDAQEIKDAMYREYEEELVNAWRRK